MKTVQQIEHFINTILIRETGKGLLKFFLKTYSDEGYYNNNVFNKWRPRLHPQRLATPTITPNPILYLTGEMKKSFHLSYSNSEINIENTAPYSSFHNVGTSKMVARPFLYQDKKVDQIIDKIVISELNRFFKK